MMTSLHGPRARGGGNAAFTLLEVLLALTILGVLVAVSLPGTGRSFHNLALREAASTLAANIRYAQAKAIAEAVTVRVLFHKAGGWYTLEYGPRQEVQSQFQPIRGIMDRTFQLPRDTIFAIVELRAEDGVSATEMLVFSPDGSGGMGRIRIAGRTGSYDVIVTGRLGEVVLQQGADRPPAAGGT